MTGKLDALCRMTDVTRNARIPAATKQSQKKSTAHMLQVQQRNCRMYFCGGDDDDEAVEVKLKFALVKDKP